MLKYFFLQKFLKYLVTINNRLLNVDVTKNNITGSKNKGCPYN